MAKIVINCCYGGFGLSVDAIAMMIHRKHDPDFEEYTISRTDPDLIAVVEELGSEKASGDYAALAIVELAEGTLYRISEYDGVEQIETRDSILWSVA